MSRAIPKKVRLGYGVWLKRLEGQSAWDRVGGLFLSRLEADRYVKNNYPSAPKVRIESIRLSAAPIAPRES